MAYETVTPIIPNTTMRKYINDSTNLAVVYLIKPIDGYVMHDKSYDYTDINPETMEESDIILGYRTSEASASINYDFEANPREFFTVLRSKVPENQIFGGGNNG